MKATLLAIKYEWLCPQCDFANTDEEATAIDDYVVCDNCGISFKVGHIDHNHKIPTYARAAR